MKRHRPPSPHISSRVLALIKQSSLRRVSRQLDLSEVTTASLAAGLNCSAETETPTKKRP